MGRGHVAPPFSVSRFGSRSSRQSLMCIFPSRSHWVSEFAPPRFQKGLSYATGWLIAMGWQTFLCGVSFSVVSSHATLVHFLCSHGLAC